MEFKNILLKGKKCRKFLKQSTFRLSWKVKFCILPVKVEYINFHTNNHPFYINESLPIIDVEQGPKWVWFDYVFVRHFGFFDNDYIATDFIEYKDRKYKINNLLKKL